MRLTGSDKLKIVKEYFDEHSSITSICRKTGKNKGVFL
jgi:transposase-like protein